MSSGRPIGSAHIDHSFQELLLKRLKVVEQYLEASPKVVAEKMMHDKFERIKCSFGTPASSEIPTYPLLIPGLSQECNFPDAEISDSKMIITRSESSLSSMTDCVLTYYKRRCEGTI